MDEQERLSLEHQLEEVLRHDLGSIPVRPFAVYNDAARAAVVTPLRRLFSIAGAAALMAVVVLVALAAAFALRELRPTPAAAPLPSVPAPASPSPASSSSADRFGYVFMNDNNERIVVQRERDAAPVFELAGVAPAVSPDGKRLAYWRTTPNVGATDLRVLDVANPTSDRSVLTLTSQSLGGSVVWSNDGQGLLVATYSRETVGGPGPERGPAQYGLLMLDLASTPPATRTAAAPVSGGAVYLPVAWDRPGQVAAAVVTGPGGYAIEYVTWNGNAASPFARAPVPRLVLAGSVQASADAKLVMGLEDNLNVLRVWPILDITKVDQVRNPSRVSLFPVWRPGATAPYEVIWAVGQKVDLFRYQTDSVTTLYTSTDYLGLAAVRPDGSGVLVLTQPSGQPLPPPTRLTIVDIATRQATEVTVIPGGFGGSHRVLSRGVLLR